MRKYFLLLSLLCCSGFAMAQYCTPGYSSTGIAAGALGEVHIPGFAGTAINDTLPSSALATGFANRSSTVAALRMQQGRTYMCSLVYLAAQSHTGNQVWIDFNSDNVFADSEMVSAVTPSMYSLSTAAANPVVAIRVPMAAPIGTYRMRIRNVVYDMGFSPGYGSAALSACSNFDGSNHYLSGITADYAVTIASLSPCAGTPVAGNATGASSVCHSTPFDLELANDTIAGNLQYQWYSKPVASGTMTAIAGATNRYYHAPSQAVATQYEAILTCPAGGGRDTSAILTVSQNPFYNCYCNLALGGDSVQTTIDSVAILAAGLSINIPHNPNPYIAFPDTGSATVSLNKGLSYTLFLRSGGTRAYSAQMWIDMNRNGSFDSIEHITINSSVIAAGGTYVGFTIPTTADTGLTGLRIRTINDSGTLGGDDACAYREVGATEDYIITILSSGLCVGRPHAGFAASSEPSVCSGVSFALMGYGTSVQTGLTYQWFSAPASSAAFTPISGATSNTFTYPSQTSATDYFLQVTCPASGMHDSSTIVAINQNDFYLCQCSPTTGVGLNNVSSTAPLDSVAIVGTTLNNVTSGAPPYVRYRGGAPTTTATLERGAYYTIAVNSHGSANYNAAMWIDLNHNATFEPTEYFNIGTNIAAGTATSAYFYVSAIADTGLTTVRVRTSDYTYTFGPGDACTNQFYGATKDYVVIVNSGTRCIGFPLAGTSTASRSSVCPLEAITLSNTGAANSLGISYQWVSRRTGTVGYTALSGGNSPSYTLPSQSFTTDYALLVTCSFSGITDTSTLVTVNQNPVYLCYCSPSSGYPLNVDASTAPIDSFFIAPTSLSNYTAGSTAPYTRFYPTTGTTTAVLHLNNNFVLGIHSPGSAGYKAQAWIDYNHNGTFDPSELIPITSGSTAGSTAYTSFIPPASADTGFTGMRVRTFADIYSPSSSDGCSEYYYGATQDYVIQLRPSLGCFGTPNGGTAFSPVIEVCAGEEFQVVATGYTHSNTTTYQWVKSPVGAGTFTPISGATNPVYLVAGGQTAGTEYAMIATCTTSGLSDTGASVLIQMKEVYLCYCSATTGTTLSTDATAAPLDSVSIVGTAINNYIPGNTDIYTLFYPATATTTDSLVQGNTYTVVVNSEGTANYSASIWIDYDRSGTYDSTEYTNVGTNLSPGTPTSVMFTIPASADTGVTGFRVRTTRFPLATAAIDACTNEYFGATQDYIIRIAPGVPCSGTPGTSYAYATQSAICTGTSFNLLDTGYSVGVGLTYQWYSRPVSGGSFTAISGATSSVLVITAQTVSTEYRYTTTCTASGLSSNSNTVTVSQIPFYFCYCTSTLGTSYASTQISKFKINGSALNIHNTFATPYKVFGMVGDSTGTLQRTFPYPVDLKVVGGSAFNAGMWIDYNHNSIFESSEYTRLDTNVASGTTSTTTLTIPTSADTGVTGMRIRTTPSSNTFRSTDACTYITNSQSYDFRVRIDTLVRCSGAPDAGTITSSTPFACPSMTFHLDNDGYAVGTGITYQWIKKTTGSYAAITGATTHTVTVSAQTVTTDYAMIARCSFSGGVDTSNVIRIVENPFDSCYCSPPTGVTLVTSGGHHNIALTTVAGTTSMSVPEQSPDSTGYVAVPPTPSTYTTTLRRYYSYPVNVYVNYTTYTITGAGVWVDYNHNSVFDSAEYVPLTQSSDHSRWSGNINVPYTSALGLTGMRVVTRESGAVTASSACSLVPVGQVQDHIINIVPAPCFSIGSATVTSITDTSARAVWAPVTGSFGYRYVFDTFSSAPTGSGIATTDTFAASGCLISGHIYYLHVSDSCDAGSVSSWITIPFTTAACPGLSTLTATSVTNTTATISWGAVTGTLGYEYLLDTSATAAITATGTGTSLLTLNLVGLTQGTTYYMHVRSGCPCSNHSAWRTVSFTTICDTITHLRTINITDSSVTLRWDSIAHISNYAYVVDTSSGAPSGTGTTATDTTVRVIGLRSGTLYYAHVRHICSGGYSTWITIPFTTTRCDTVTGLTGIPSDTGIAFHWNPVTGSMGYYYVINSVAAPPIGTTGTYSPGTSDTAVGLLSNHHYYVHVRTDCSGGSSGWVTIAVTTLVCDTASGLTVGSLCDTSAILSWTTSGGAGYLYVVDNTAADPTVTGTYSSVGTIYLNTLIPGTSYYAHVRHLCSAVDTSAWTDVHFTTPACDPVTGLTATAITTNGATISWTGIACVAGYYYVLDNSSGAPSVTGIFLTTNTTTETTLTPGTLYYAHVRVSCGSGVLSAWVNIPFTTLNCLPTTVNISSLSWNSAQVNWTPVAGAVGYEYAVDNSAIAPTSGTFAASTTLLYSATGLTPLTLYYAHVRELCVGGLYSTWVDEPFTTTGVGVQVVNSNSFAVSAYPNPVTEKLSVTVTAGAENGVIYIADLTGKILLTAAIVADRAEVDMSKLAAGIYMLRYQDDAHTQIVKLNKQ